MTDPTTLAGRYRLHHPLDAAATGWRATDELLHRPVTVRPVPADALPAVRAAAAVRHPAVVTVHDVLTEDGRAWIVTEPAEGATLLAAGALPQAQVAELGLELLDGLATAHALDVVHGGVEPSAVVWCADGRFKLAGFGTARPQAAYTPPEQVPGPAADLWGLAATLSTAAEGRGPFPTPDALRYGQALPAVRAPGLHPVLAAALHPDPAQRPDAGALRAGLRERAPSPRGSGGPWRVHPAALALGAAVLTAVIVPVTVAIAAPDPAPGSAAAAPELGALPDACGLLTGDRLAQVVPGAAEPSGYQEGACGWRTDTAAGDLPGSLRFSLDLQVELADDPGGKLAAARETAGWGGKTAPVASLGDEAFLKEEAGTSSTGQKRFTVTVVFRQADAVATLRFARDAGASGPMRETAVRGARWVAEAMSRG